MKDSTPDILAIFTEAVSRQATDDRKDYLDDACEGDPQARQRVETLLRAHFDAGKFLEGQPPEETLIVNQPPTERPGTQIGSYKLLQKIGEGGFGVVYMADQTEPVRRKVALKVIKPGMDSKGVVARFEAERQALALMTHPNIAQVFDGGTTDSGRPYFVMELVRGVPLTDYCDENKLPVKVRLELFATVCRAIQHAHQKGVIHRDIKPSNVMVTLHDGEPVPKVIDFGISKAISQRLTEKTLFTAYGQMIGTPAYMSPEQAEMSGIDTDTRSDIYSLGVLLYELLTDTTPFDQETLQNAGFDELRRIIREVEPPRPSARVSTLNAGLLSTISDRRHIDPRKLSHSYRGELDWIVMKALEKDRNRRYESASAFVTDVERYLNNEPVQACPPSTGYRLRKFARRNKGGLAVGALVLFFVVVLGSGVGWTVRDRQTREQEMAMKAKSDLALTEQGVRRAVEQAEKIHGELLATLAKPGGVQKLLKQSSRWNVLILSAQSELARARQSAARARGCLSEELTQKLSKLEKQLVGDADDRLLALRLENIRMDKANWVEGWFDFRHAATEYPQAFARFAVLEEDAATVGGKLRSSPIHEQLVAALDDWALVAYFLKNQELTEQILAVTRHAAPDPDWGDQLRQVKSWRDREALAKLVEDAPLARLSPQMLVLVGNVLEFQNSSLLESWLRRAQAQYPADYWMNFNLGHFLNNHLRNKTQRLESTGFFRVALAVRPASNVAYNDLGRCLLDQGNLDKAIDAFRKAIEIGPEFANVHVNLGIALARQEKLDEAIAAFRKAIEIDPKYVYVYNNLGDALARQERWDEAIAFYNTLITAETTHSDLLKRRATAYVSTGKWDLAKADWLRAVKAKPELTQAAFDIYCIAERWSEAAEFGLLLIEYNPNDAMPWLRVAPVLAVTDDAAYREFCVSMANQFAGTKDPIQAERTCKAGLLRADSIDLDKLPVDTLASYLDTAAEPHWLRPYAWASRALLAYRRGDAESAVKYVDQSQQHEPNPLIHALNLIVRALALNQLGKSDEAGQAFKAAAEQVNRLEQNPQNKGNFDLLIAQILLREAEELNDAAKPKMPSDDSR